MARPLRIERAGAWYHITARGNERRSIYRHQRDYRHFCELLGDTVERFRWRLHAYVLMPNHYHLLVETSEPNLSASMQWLSTGAAATSFKADLRRSWSIQSIGAWR